MADGRTLAFVARQVSVARLPAKALVLPVHPSVTGPADRLVAARPEALLSPDDGKAIESAVSHIVAEWWREAPDETFVWREVSLADCFSQELEYAIRDLVKSAVVLDRAIEVSSPDALATDLQATAGALPAYPYLHGLGSLLRSRAEERNVPCSFLGGLATPPPRRRASRVGRAYARIAAKAARVRLLSERPLVALGPHPEFHVPVAEAWNARGGVTIVVTPSRLPVRSVPRRGLFVLPLGSLLTVEDHSEVRAYVQASVAQVRTGSLGGPLVQRDADLTSLLRDHLVQRLGRDLGVLAAMGTAFDRGLERARGLVAVESGTPLAKAAIRYARRCGVPVTVVQHGVLAGAASYRRTEADRVAAWGPADAEWFRRALDPRVRVEPTGCPRYDGLAAGKPASARKFRSLPTGTRLAVFASQPFVPDRASRSPWERSGAIRMALEAGRATPGLRVVVKWHPSEAPEQLPDAQDDVLARSVRRARTLELLAGADVVLALSSTVALEAMFLRKPVVFLGPTDPTSPFQPPEEGAGLRARDAEELAGHLGRLLSDPVFRERVLRGQREFVRRHHGPLDGRSAERVANLLAQG